MYLAVSLYILATRKVRERDLASHVMTMSWNLEGQIDFLFLYVKNLPPPVRRHLTLRVCKIISVGSRRAVPQTWNVICVTAAIDGMLTTAAIDRMLIKLNKTGEEALEGFHILKYIVSPR